MQGVTLLLLAMMILPCMDAIAKYLAVHAGMSPAQVTFYRFFFQLVATLPMLLRLGGPAALTPRRPWYNIMRGVVLAAAALFFFVSVKYMPLADVFAIYFVEPFILTCLSALILREAVGWRRWLAIAIGFGGAMIVIQPSFQVFGLTALMPVACAFLFACYLLMNRASGPADTPLAMQTFAGIGGTVFMIGVIAVGHALGAADFVPSLPQTPLAWLLVVTLGTISGYGHLMVVKAFRAAPVSLLAPFHYFEIVTATVLGYLVFGEFPTPSKWLGIAIIVGSGLFMIWREHRRQAA
jgi:drug/metabolite transporter (DMT)-like permease